MSKAGFRLAAVLLAAAALSVTFLAPAEARPWKPSPQALAQDYLQSSWSVYGPTRWDWATFFGTIGLFLFLFFLFIRLLPAISIFEVRTMLPRAKAVEESGD